MMQRALSAVMGEDSPERRCGSQGVDRSQSGAGLGAASSPSLRAPVIRAPFSWQSPDSLPSSWAHRAPGTGWSPSLSSPCWQVSPEGPGRTRALPASGHQQ